jgi:hypothetical protein
MVVSAGENKQLVEPINTFKTQGIKRVVGREEGYKPAHDVLRFCMVEKGDRYRRNTCPILVYFSKYILEF